MTFLPTILWKPLTAADSSLVRNQERTTKMNRNQRVQAALNRLEERRLDIEHQIFDDIVRNFEVLTVAAQTAATVFNANDTDTYNGSGFTFTYFGIG